MSRVAGRQLEKPEKDESMSSCSPSVRAFPKNHTPFCELHSLKHPTPASGGTPHFKLSKGFVLDNPNICSKAFFNLLTTIPPSLLDPASQPKFVTVTSYGIMQSSHSKVPFVLKPLYGFALQGPHADKLALEKLIAHCAGWEWDASQEIDPEIMAPSVFSDPNLPKPGQLQRIVVVRPALLTDGVCKAETTTKDTPYRVQEGDLSSVYTISRRDVAHFISEKVLNEWDQWEGKGVSIAY